MKPEVVDVLKKNPSNRMIINIVLMLFDFLKKISNLKICLFLFDLNTSNVPLVDPKNKMFNTSMVIFW